MKPHPDRDLLGPVEFAVNVLATLTAILVAVVIAASVFGSGDAFGFTYDRVCAAAEPGLLRTGATPPRVLGLAPDAAAIITDMRICSDDTGIAVRLVHDIGNIADLLLWVAVLGLVHHLLRQVRREGFFTERNALRVTRLGWVVLVGIVVAAAVRAAANGVVLSELVPRTDLLVGVNEFHLSLATLLIGFGLVTFGRVLQRGVAMQDDIDATI